MESVGNYILYFFLLTFFSLERRLPTYIDEDEANDVVEPLSKDAKMPDKLFQAQFMTDMLTSPTVTRMFKDRGRTELF